MDPIEQAQALRITQVLGLGSPEVCISGSACSEGD